MTGSLRYASPQGGGSLDFRYRVVRVWETPVEAVLQGGLGTLPLAPLASVSRKALPEVVHRMQDRIRAEATQTEAASLWTATYVLMGLRYPPEFTAKLLEGVREMEESTTYQAILAKGEARGEARGKIEGKAETARAILLQLGAKRLGAPDAKVLVVLNAITSADRLEVLARSVLDVENWVELLSIPE